MKIIGLTDIHNHLNLSANAKVEIKKADLIVLTGDITHFGRRKETELIIRELRNLNESILAVRGNCDFPEVEEYLDNEKINLHKNIKEVNGIQFTGLGGSLPCPGITPHEYTEKEYDGFLHDIISELNKNKPFILISHQPPFNTKSDAVSKDYHVGSKSIRTFIENHKPMACLTGHIHEGIDIDIIGKTVIINPGPNRNGHYSIIEIKDNLLTDSRIL